MGQIFNRIKRITKASFISDDELQQAEKMLFDTDSSLEKEFENLAKDPPPNSPKAENSTVRMDLSNACRILQIEQSAGIDEIKSAYKRLSMQYHPDRTASLGIELRQLAEQKMLEINSAYQFLKKIRDF